jgi:hypothetical protein
MDKRRDHRESKGVEDLIFILYYLLQYYVTGADINDEKGEPQDKKGEVMIGILSSMNETLKGVKRDTNKTLEKQDETIDAIDQSKEEIVAEISSLSQPFSF